MVPPADLDRLSRAEHKSLTIQLLEENAELRQTLAELCEEKARLRACLDQPNIKPSGIEKTAEPNPETPRRPK